MNAAALLAATLAVAVAWPAPAMAAAPKARKTADAPAPVRQGTPYAGREDACSSPTTSPNAAAWTATRVRAAVAPGAHAAGGGAADAAGAVRHAEELGAVPQPLHRQRAHPGRRALLAGQPRTLERAEREYGVPPDIVVGIIGVETIYGQQMGTFRVLDALATLAFDFPPGAPARRRAHGLLPRRAGGIPGVAAEGRHRPDAPAGQLCRRDGHAAVHAQQLGALGGGLRRRRAHRPVAQPADVIGSVASYFKGYGWQPGMPTHFPVTFDRTARQGSAAGARHPADLQRAQLPGQGRRAGRHRRAAHRPAGAVELQNGTDAPATSPARRTST
jgi:membrane-bound lytic murein transglycosylase B